MAEERSDPVALEYATPSPPRPRRLGAVLFAGSFVHLLVAVFTLVVGGGDWNGLTFVLFVPLYLLFQYVEAMPFSPVFLVFVLVPLNSMFYGTVFAAVVVMVRRL